MVHRLDVASVTKQSQEILTCFQQWLF